MTNLAQKTKKMEIEVNKADSTYYDQRNKQIDELVENKGKLLKQLNASLKENGSVYKKYNSKHYQTRSLCQITTRSHSDVR